MRELKFGVFTLASFVFLAGHSKADIPFTLRTNAPGYGTIVAAQSFDVNTSGNGGYTIVSADTTNFSQAYPAAFADADGSGNAYASMNFNIGIDDVTVSANGNMSLGNAIPNMGLGCYTQTTFDIAFTAPLNQITLLNFDYDTSAVNDTANITILRDETTNTDIVNEPMNISGSVIDWQLMPGDVYNFDAEGYLYVQGKTSFSASYQFSDHLYLTEIPLPEPNSALLVGTTLATGLGCWRDRRRVRV